MKESLFVALFFIGLGIAPTIFGDPRPDDMYPILAIAGCAIGVGFFILMEADRRLR